MNRRESLRALLALTALSGSGRTDAQNQRRIRRIGYLMASTGADFPLLHDALRRGLLDAGFTDGQNIEIVVRSANGDAKRFPALVAELVAQDVEVIFASNSAAAVAAKAGASAVPLVFAGVGDPIGLGLVETLRRPGGNVTGIALLTPELTPKRLALLKEINPEMRRVAVLWNPSIKGHREQLEKLKSTSGPLGVSIKQATVERLEEFETAFESMRRDRADGLIVLASPLHHRNLRQLADLALRYKLPGICEFSEFTEVGGLLVYGPSWPDMYRHAATYVAKILHGSKPADLPVEQPTKIQLLLNSGTARKLGLTVPPSILVRVDQTTE